MLDYLKRVFILLGASLILGFCLFLIRIFLLFLARGIGVEVVYLDLSCMLLALLIIAGYK